MASRSAAGANAPNDTDAETGTGVLQSCCAIDVKHHDTGSELRDFIVIQR